MVVTNPQSLWNIGLAPLVPGIYFVGRTLALRSGVDRGLAANLAPALGVAVLLTLLHATAYATGSLDLALPLVFLPLGLLGWGLWLLGREGGRPGQQRLWLAPPRGRWLMLAALTVLVAPTAFGWAFHDELFFTGHMSITAQLQNGTYPPHHLTFPQFELRYHYGFNLLCAVVTALTRLDITTAIDLVTLASWAYVANLLWLLGERLFGTRGAGIMVVALVLLGGGLDFFCAGEGAPLPYHLLGLCKIDGAIVNPPVVSYFFQHPWTLGIPLMLSTLLLLLDAGGNRPMGLALAVFFLLAALSLSQIVLFATVGASLVAAAFRLEGEWSIKRGVATATVALAALALATQWGGVFAPAPDDLGGDLQFHLGMADSLGGTVRWHLATFGLLLPLGLAGFCWLPRLRLFLGLLVVGSLLVINLVRHAHSWDIAKFGTVAAIALAITSAGALLHLWHHQPGRRFYVPVLLTLTLAAGVLFPVTFACRLDGIPTNLFHPAAQVLSSDDVDAINWLRPRMAPGELVYRRFPEVSGYAQQAGLAQPWVDNMVARHGYSAQRIQRRMSLLTNWPSETAPYRAEGLRFLVVGREDVRLQEHTKRWVASGDASVAATFGSLFIVDLGL